MRTTTIPETRHDMFTLRQTRTVRPSSWAIALLLFGAIGGGAYLLSQSGPSRPAAETKADAEAPSAGATAPTETAPAPQSAAVPPTDAGTTQPGSSEGDGSAPATPPQQAPAPPLEPSPPATADDHSVDALIAQSRAASDRGEHQAALAAAEAAVALDPDHADALLAQGRALYDLGRFEAAKTALLRSIDVDPAEAEARNLLGLVYLELGRNLEALDEFQEAATLAPDDEVIRRNLERARERIATDPTA